MKNRIRKVSLAIITFAALMLIWQAYVTFFKVPEHLLPGPIVLLQSLVSLFTSGVIISHIGITLYEIFIGFVIGTVLGILFGYILAKNPTLERLLTPYVVLLQTIPKISLAPLFILWFGLGATSKIALVILVVFFPIMVNCIVGVRSVEKDMQNLLTILKASAWQKFISVEVPFSLPFIMSGIKVGTTYAITGAVIGELIGAKGGLGYLVTLGSETYDIKMIMSSVLILSIIGLILYLLVSYIEKKALHWHESQEIIM
jgi:NitT/TauT family transport system permease protein